MRKLGRTEEYEEQTRTIMRLFNAGLNCAEIGRMMGFSRGKVHNRVTRQLGCKPTSVVSRGHIPQRVTKHTEYLLSYPSLAVRPLQSGSAYKSGRCTNQNTLTGWRCENEQLPYRSYCAECGGALVYENGLRSSFPECEPMER